MLLGRSRFVLVVVVAQSVCRLVHAQHEATTPIVQSAITQADYDMHITALKTKLPAGFSYVIQPPFVVIGDGGATSVQRHATQVVKWAVDKLKQEYFAKDPAAILDIWLFKDKASYDKHTQDIFDDEPTSPYGYYSPTHKALIMNIGTGGGTLVHEIVHPFIEANFPACPPWFNEGLGSLYEQSMEKDGHIWGLVNWRLGGLQKAIGANGVPPFEKLCAMNSNQFYNLDRGTNYGQSRYLCLYMQEKSLLRRFYQEFTAHQKEDPTGYQTLKKVLGMEDMDAFKKQWEAWVMALKF